MSGSHQLPTLTGNAPTLSQMLSIQYLTDETHRTLSISKSDLYRHPDVGHKHRTEAATAAWQ